MRFENQRLLAWPIAAVITVLALALPGALRAQDPVYLSNNPFKGDTLSSFDSRVNEFSPIGARNRFTIDGGRVYAQDGKYLGRLDSNPYDPESVANPYGRYGSSYSQESVNNPYSPYGSECSSYSARNPYASRPPVVLYGGSRAPGTTAPPLLPAYRYCSALAEDC